MPVSLLQRPGRRVRHFNNYNSHRMPLRLPHAGTCVVFLEPRKKQYCVLRPILLTETLLARTGVDWSDPTMCLAGSGVWRSTRQSDDGIARIRVCVTCQDRDTGLPDHGIDSIIIIIRRRRRIVIKY